MVRRPAKPSPEDRVLSVAEMRSAIDRLGRRLGELKQLDPRSVTTYRSSEIVSLETGIEQTLVAVFGQGTPKYNLYRLACDLEPAPILDMTPDWIAARGGGYAPIYPPDQRLQQEARKPAGGGFPALCALQSRSAAQDLARDASDGR
jgi:hypothetical protein